MAAELEKINSLTVTGKIDDLQLYMLDAGEPAFIPMNHGFVPGMYIREMIVPAGTLIVGKVHLTEDPYALMTGSIMVFTENDGTAYLHAGHTGITVPGTRRVGYCTTVCHWINYHVLSAEEEEARKSGMNEDDLVELIESRIFEEMPILDDRGGNTVYELYQEKLGKALLCQE